MSIYQGNKKISNNVTMMNIQYSMPIGSIIPFGGNTTIPTGYLECNGDEVSKTEYPELFSVIGNSFGTPSSDSKFKLPDLRNKFVQGGSVNNVGTVKEAGLPELSGKLGYIKSGQSGLYYQGINVFTGVFKDSIQNDSSVTPPACMFTAVQASGDSKIFPSTVNFKASTSNSIYGNSTTVQPPAVCMIYIIKALQVDSLTVDTGILDDTSNTADRTWSSEKINNSVILKNDKIIKSSVSSTGSNTLSVDVSSLGLSHGIYHYKLALLGPGNISHYSEGSLGIYDDLYSIDPSYKSLHITDISINNKTITIKTDFSCYSYNLSIRTMDDWLIN